MTEIILDNTQERDVKLSPKNALGGPAKVEPGSAKCVLISGTAQVFQDDPALDVFAIVSSDDENDVSEFELSGDADLGQGVTLITERIIVTGQAAPAVSIGVEVGAPRAKRTITT